VRTVNSKDAADKKDDSASGDKDTADVSNETENESVETGAQTSDDEEVFVDDSLDGEAQETYQETTTMKSGRKLTTRLPMKRPGRHLVMNLKKHT